MDGPYSLHQVSQEDSPQPWSQSIAANILGNILGEVEAHIVNLVHRFFP